MDNIKFVIEDAQEIEGATFKSYDISIYLNDEKLPHQIFNVEAVLPLVNYKYVEFDLFTCSCGVPECAGFQAHVIHNVKDGIVEWKFPEEDYYKTAKKLYQFEESAFKELFNNLFKTMLKMEEHELIHTTFVSDDSMYSSEDLLSQAVVIKYSLKKSFDWKSGVYQSLQNFQETLSNNFPKLINKKIKYTYDGVLSTYTNDLDYIVGKLLNQFPRNGDNSFFLAKTKLAAKAVSNYLNGDKELFEKIAYHSYERNCFSSHNIIHWDFPDLKEEDFDIKKLGLVLVN